MDIGLLDTTPETVLEYLREMREPLGAMFATLNVEDAHLASVEELDREMTKYQHLFARIRRKIDR